MENEGNFATFAVAAAAAEEITMRENGYINKYF